MWRNLASSLVFACALAACAQPVQSPSPVVRSAVASPATTSPPEPIPTETLEIGYIDTHMHLSGVRRGDQTHDYRPAAENLVALMDQVGVEKALVMHLSLEPGDAQPYGYEELLAAIQEHPGRLYFMGGGGTLSPFLEATPPDDVTPEITRQFVQEAEEVLAAGALGFGEMMAMHFCMNPAHGYIEVLPDHPLFLVLADIAAEHDVPIDLHMEAIPEAMTTPPALLQRCSKNPATLPATIPGFERLLSHNRNARIVWQHVGWDNTGHMTVDLVRRLLDQHPNLYIAIRVEAGGVSRADNPAPNRIVDSDDKVKPEWLALFEEFPDRVMIGGDEFVGVPGRTPERPQSFEETWAILSQLSPELARKIGGENAARVYGLSD